MPHVRTSELSPHSRLHAHVRHGDFLDCYSTAANLPPRNAAQVITAFPGWARTLLALRRVLVTPFGLRHEGPDDGDRIGPFPVTAETPEEIIAGFDDAHLDFRICVHCAQGRVSLATWVHPHNIGGRAYLALIMPFHIAIARNALARVHAYSRSGQPPQTPLKAGGN